MWKIFAVAFVLMVFNSILTYRQAKDFTISFNEIRKFGNVSVGKDKQYFIYGVILILACDSNGYVTKGKIMKGFSVFARFNNFDALNGKSIYDLKEEEEEKMKKIRSKRRKKKGSSLLQAVNGLIGVLEKNKTNNDEIELQEEIKKVVE
ncbi:transcriptional regulator GutM [Anaerofustis stercorihominis]|uniref:transcriptional regulator GutM n=1 Tax=Anaerofustis stercorihominis TaxID=214853 RepID=UPI0011071B3A|nr:transcriptional regulator GutM [Anaerofustis stercorihominis]